MKKVIMSIDLIAMVTMLILTTTGCDTELGHQDHDHDGDGIQDHAAEDHEDEHDDLEEEMSYEDEE